MKRSIKIRISAYVENQAHPVHIYYRYTVDRAIELESLLRQRGYQVFAETI